MLIGELSKKTGFSRDTIRYYEKLGLIRETARAGQYNNYKNYTEPVLKKLLAIRKIKDYGFTLKETQNMLVLFEEGVLEHERGNRYIKRKIALINNKIKELEMIKNRLEEIVDPQALPGNCALSKILNEMATNEITIS
ncbi:MAG: MerR family transcriptional regulator [Chitinophagaceae bacterium]